MPSVVVRSHSKHGCYPEISVNLKIDLFPFLHTCNVYTPCQDQGVWVYQPSPRWWIWIYLPWDLISFKDFRVEFSFQYSIFVLLFIFFFQDSVFKWRGKERSKRIEGKIYPGGLQDEKMWNETNPSHRKIWKMQWSELKSQEWKKKKKSTAFLHKKEKNSHWFFKLKFKLAQWNLLQGC